VATPSENYHKYRFIQLFASEISVQYFPALLMKILMQNGIFSGSEQMKKVEFIMAGVFLSSSVFSTIRNCSFTNFLDVFEIMKIFNWAIQSTTSLLWQVVETKKTMRSHKNVTTSGWEIMTLSSNYEIIWNQIKVFDIICFYTFLASSGNFLGAELKILKLRQKLLQKMRENN
jgi:hypothetical protein